MLIEPFIFLSLAAALSFTCADIFARKGLQYANHFVGATITLVGEVALFLPLIFLLAPQFPEMGTHYLWVIIGGLCNPGPFLIFFLIGIHRIGVARAAPIKGMSPIFAALFALIFLGEDPAWYHMMGVLFVVCGIVLLVSGKTGGRWSRWDARWPLIAAMISGFWGHVLEKRAGCFHERTARLNGRRRLRSRCSGGLYLLRIARR